MAEDKHRSAHARHLAALFAILIIGLIALAVSTTSLVAQDFGDDLDVGEESQTMRTLFGGEEEDFSHRYLNEIFGPIFEYQGSAGRTNIFVIIIGYFNIFALILGAILFFYNVSVGVLQSAHEGQVLGRRWNSLWAPIRVIIAVGLLVPLPNMGGYNAVQGGIAYLVKGSTNVASYVWGQAASGILSNGVPIAGGVANVDAEVIEAIYRMNVCRAVNNYQLENAGDDRRIEIGYASDLFGELDLNPRSTGGWGDLVAEGRRTEILGEPNLSFTTTLAGGDDADASRYAGVCGSIRIPSPPQYIVNIDDDDVQSRALAQYADTHLGVVENINTRANDIISGVWEGVVDRQGPPSGDLRSELISILDDANADLNEGLGEMLTDVMGDREGDDYSRARARIEDHILGAECEDGVSGRCHGEGWVGAGSWYMLIARMNNEVLGVFSGSPGTEGERHSDLDIYNPGIWGSMVSAFGGDTDEGVILEESNRMVDQLETYFNEATSGLAQYGFAIDTSEAAQARPSTYGENPWLRDILGPSLASSVDWLTNPMRNYDDPIVGVLLLGNTLINIGVGIFAADIVANFTLGGFVGDALTGGTLSSAVSALSGALSALAGISIAAGGVLMFIIPMMPFFFWVIGVTGYFLLVAEAIVASSIWAIAHMRMDGEGISGDSARQGYMMVLALLLTPVLMIFGFIVGMAIFRVTGQLVNAGYGYAVTGIMGSNPLPWLVGLVSLSVLQVLIFLVLIERSFSLITEFPTRVLNWIGARADLTRGEEDRVRMAAVGAGWMISRGSQQLQGGMDKGAQHAGNRMIQNKGSASGS